MTTPPASEVPRQSPRQSVPPHGSDGRIARAILIPGNNSLLIAGEDLAAVQELFRLSMPGMRESIKTGMAEAVASVRARPRLRAGASFSRQARKDAPELAGLKD